MGLFIIFSIAQPPPRRKYRQTSVAVDLSQQMAAKAALQYAAAELAERVLPRIAN